MTILANITRVGLDCRVAVVSGLRHTGLLQTIPYAPRRGMRWRGKAGSAWQGEAVMACLGMSRQGRLSLEGTFGCLLRFWRVTRGAFQPRRQLRAPSASAEAA